MNQTPIIITIASMAEISTAIFSITGPYDTYIFGTARTLSNPAVSAIMSALQTLPVGRFLTAIYGRNRPAGSSLPLAITVIHTEDLNGDERFAATLQRFDVTYERVDDSDPRISALREWVVARNEA